MEWNNGVTTAKYAYIQNLQGDIAGIIDASGTEVVKYTYDAWGKVLSTTGSLAATLGTVQPFRYRGYVYDVETGLYYLRSRYYDPAWQRFICIDELIAKIYTAINNAWSYCENNPIRRIDREGSASKDLIPTENDGYCIWLMNQMDNEEPWDLKKPKGWETQLPNIKMPSPKEQFIFRGYKINAEDLGNICYGYLGTAMGVNPELLYSCGGVVNILGKQKKDVKDLTNSFWGNLHLADMIISNLNDPPLYGDNENDHIMIELGINMYYEDFHNME